MKLCIQVGDVALAADLVGTGPEVLLLHAGGERRQVWRPVAEALAGAGFSALAVDQRGHGESGGSRGDSIDAYAEDVRGLLRERGGCPLVVGASLGGFAAMLALAQEDLQAQAAGLVLVDVVPDPDPHRVRAFLAQGAGQLDASPLAGEILDRADDFRAAVTRLALPMMLVLAGRSAISPEEVQRLQARAPQLSIVTIPEAGHLVARDAPMPLAEVLLDFLKNDAVRARQAQCA